MKDPRWTSVSESAFTLLHYYPRNLADGLAVDLVLRDALAQ